MDGTDTAWSGDLSYGYLSELLSTVRANFDTCLLHDAPRVLAAASARSAFIRHDIDVAPRFSLPVGRMEAELGIRASYQFMVDSLLYRVEDASTRHAINELLDLGHEVGLHVHVPESLLSANPYSDAARAHVHSASKRLEAVIGGPVKTMSFHRPQPQLLRGPMIFDGKVNAYSAPLMAWYLADSAGRWRNGPPIQTLLASAQPVLQLLIHPIWWGPAHMSAPDRLQSFFEEETQGKNGAFAASFDGYLSETMHAVRRSGHERRPVGESA